MPRKPELRRRGCQGWCSLHLAWSFLKWCFKQARAVPGPLNATMAQSGPQTASMCPQLPALCVQVQVKGGWAEFCPALGYPTCASWLLPLHDVQLHQRASVRVQRPVLAEGPLGAALQVTIVEYAASARRTSKSPPKKSEQPSWGRAACATIERPIPAKPCAFSKIIQVRKKYE